MPLRWLRIICGLVLSLVLSSGASAQTTQPVPSEWEGAVHQLAELLVGADADALTTSLTPPPVIRSFHSDTLQSPQRLYTLTRGSAHVSARAYLQIPATLATDLSADFSAAETVPESARTAMAPPDDAAAKRANETAAQWLAHVLQPAKDQVTAAIVLWPDPRRASLSGPVRRATFVLVKGQLIDGRYVICQISVGDPLEPPR